MIKRVPKLSEYLRRRNPDIIYGNYVWDSDKEDANVRLHGFNFRNDAISALEDSNEFSDLDDAHSQNELRGFTLGMLPSGIILKVVWTQRRNSTRIISAYKPDAWEANLYYGG